MSDERIAALRYFLDLDNPYLGVDQQRIREGIAALKSLESQNQALQEESERLKREAEDGWGLDADASALRARAEKAEVAAASPLQALADALEPLVAYQRELHGRTEAAWNHVRACGGVHCRDILRPLLSPTQETDPE